MDKMSGESMDIVKDNISKLKQIFPEVFCEDKIDFERLQEVLGEYIDDKEEKYRFEWHGKSKAIRMAQTPSRGTLRPCKEESKNWDTTQNLYIKGDNLEVLKLLQKSYYGKVKMIYIDPPYNTGKDFVYPDNFHDNLENYKKITGQVDSDGNRIGTNTEASGRYHTDWLNMMYPRLRLARNLLADDGVIFMSIDDNEVENLKKICNEVFGESNYLAEFPRVTKKGGKSSDVTAKNHDYILLYAKNTTISDLIGVSHDDSGYSNQDEFFEERGYYKLNQTLDYDSLGYSQSLDYPIELDGETFYPGGDIELYNNRQNGQHSRADWAWRWSKELFNFGLHNGFIEVRRGGTRPRIYTKTYQKVKIDDASGQYAIVAIDRTRPLSTLEFTENKYSNDNAKKVFDALMDSSVFEYTKPPELISQLSRLVNDRNFIILDFFSGSATTAHAVMQLNAEDGSNRKFICVQLPEPCEEGSEAFKAGYKNICEIGKERIRRAGDKIVEENKDKEGIENLDIGFKVFKLDTSNIKTWNPDYKNLETTLDDMIDNFVPGRTEEDVVYEIMLKYGIDLTYPIEIRKVCDKNVYSIGMGALLICLDNEITLELVNNIVELKNELDPKTCRVVFKDNGFKTDSVKTNAVEILKRNNIEEIMSI